MSPRTLTLVSLALITPLGFASKLYRGTAQHYLNNSLAGIAYEIFWCLALFLIWPARRAIAPICIGVFLATTALEFLQRWNPPPLAAIRSTFLGKALLGTTFSWLDIPHYAIGCAIAYVWLRLILRLGSGQNPATQPPAITADVAAATPTPPPAPPAPSSPASAP